MDEPRDPTPETGSSGSSAPDPARETTGDPGPDETPVTAPAAGDDDVLARLARRTATTAGILGICVLLITGTGLWWPGWFARPVGLVIGIALIAVCTLGAVILLRRAGSWTAVGAASLRDQPGVRAVVGEPRPLHRSDRVMIRRRRFPAQVVPVRSASGPWADGAALLVHGRADGVQLHADDDVAAHWVTPRGPYLLERPADGALFAAERSTFGAW